jgi:hypothetical protein
MMNRKERGGSQNHHLLPLSVFPVQYPDFINIEREIGRTTLDRFVHAACSSIEEHSWNLQMRLFFWRASLLDQFRGMTSNEGIRPSARNIDLADLPAIVFDLPACYRCIFLRLAGDPSQDICVRFRVHRQIATSRFRLVEDIYER